MIQQVRVLSFTFLAGLVACVSGGTPQPTSDTPSPTLAAYSTPTGAINPIVMPVITENTIKPITIPLNTVITEDNTIDPIAMPVITVTTEDTTHTTNLFGHTLDDVMTFGDPFTSKSDIDEFKQEIKSKYDINVKIISSGVLKIGDYSRIKSLDFSLFTKREISVLEEAIEEAFPFCAGNIENLEFERRFIASPPYSISGLHRDDTIVITISVAPGPEYLGIDSPIAEDYGEYKIAGIVTYADLLRQVYGHECGHRSSDAILRAAHPPEIYDKIINPEGIYGINIINYEGVMINMRMSSQIENNPLYEAFAELEGWKKLTEDAPNKHFIYVKASPDTRTSPEANYVISEHLAELFAFSIYKSSNLTRLEKTFFRNFHERLKTNPEVGAKQIAEDPMLLLR